MTVVLNWAMVAYGGTLNAASTKYDSDKWYVIQVKEGGPHDAYPIAKYNIKSHAVDRAEGLVESNPDYAGAAIQDKHARSPPRIILSDRGKNAIERLAWDRGGLPDPL